MRNLIIAAVAVACLAGAGSAQAQYSYQSYNQSYYEDYNGNYNRNDSLPWQTWMPREEIRYVNCRVVNNMHSIRSMDRNYDGYLTSWEFRSAGFDRTAFYQLDLNNNDIVTR